MAWYRNHYHCGECGTDWEDEWSCCCDDECPECGSRNWSPYDSEDLTFIVETNDDSDQLTVYESPRVAGHYPDYQIAATVTDRTSADSYIRWRMAANWHTIP